MARPDYLIQFCQLKAEEALFGAHPPLFKEFLHSCVDGSQVCIGVFNIFAQRWLANRRLEQSEMLVTSSKL